MPVAARADLPSLVEREAALVAGQKAVQRRGEDADRREAAIERREQAVERRERAILPREGAAQASASRVAQIRRVNERLVLTTVHAQVRRDIAEQATARMVRDAQHDTLTGLPNRALLADRLEQAIGAARDQGLQLALLFIDLDHFKRVNDTLGHPAGDLLLKVVACHLRNCVRQTDTVCRLGGDEFIILLSEVHAVGDAIVAARQVLAALSAPDLINGRKAPVTASIGISLFPDDGADPETLLEAADIAMYEAKRNGRNNYVVSTQPTAKRPGGKRRILGT